MRYLALAVLLLTTGCGSLSGGVVLTNAPASMGNCMPEKPAGGCP